MDLLRKENLIKKIIFKIVEDSDTVSLQLKSTGDLDMAQVSLNRRRASEG